MSYHNNHVEIVLKYIRYRLTGKFENQNIDPVKLIQTILLYNDLMI